MPVSKQTRNLSNVISNFVSKIWTGWILFAVMISFIQWSIPANADNISNHDKSGAALHGYDPVSYFKPNGPQKGDPKIQSRSGDLLYSFASTANRDEFVKDPKKFEPQFGGWCAYAVADSKSKVDVDPKSFVIQNGRLLLFYNGIWGNTREKWLHSKDKNPESYLQTADANWPEVKNKEP